MLKLADSDELIQLHTFYCRLRRPFFVDVSGPPRLMSLARFIEHCTENDSQIWLWKSAGENAGCLHFRDKQPGLELANFDAVFFDAYPAPQSKAALSLGKEFRRACAAQKISRVQLLALDEERDKIALMEDMGFGREGVLRRHFYHGERYHDLIVLGWTAKDRSKRLAALAEDQADAGSAAPKSAPLARLKPLDKSGLLSRRVAASDSNTLVRWYGDPLIMETIEDEELSPRQLRAKAKKLAGLNEFTDGECAFIIGFDGQPVALAHFMWFDWVSRSAELDFFLAPGQKHGPFLANMIVREIGRIGFIAFNLNKLYGFTYASNETSLRLNSVFLQTEAVLKDYLPRKGGGADVHIQSLLAEDYFKKFAPRASNGTNGTDKTDMPR